MSNNRYRHIDAIRAIAALAVLYFHGAAEFLRHNWTYFQGDHLFFIFFTEIVDLGKFGVILFFAVSGFVIPFSLLNGKRHAIRDFVVSRIFRLYPAYWLSIPLGAYFFYVADGKNLPKFLIFYNISMFQQFFGKENIIGLYWTLQIEIVFYVLCLLLFITGLLQKQRAVFWIALGMLGSSLALGIARFMLERKLPVVLPLSLSIMFFGMLWRTRLIEASQAGRRYSNLFLLSLAILMPVISLLSYNEDLGYHETWYRYTITYGVAVGAFVLLTTRWQIRSHAAAYLGTISYSIYLFGPISQALIIRLFPPAHHDMVPSDLYLLGCVVTTIALASVTYRFVERPAILAGRRINAWLDFNARSVSSATDIA